MQNSQTDHVSLSDKATAILALTAEKEKLMLESQDYNAAVFDLVRRIKEFSMLQQDNLNKIADIDDTIAKIAFSQLGDLKK